MAKEFSEKSVREIMLSVIDFFVYSNIWLSLGGAIFYTMVYSTALDEFRIPAGAFLTFFAVLFLYTFLRFRSLNHSLYQQSPVANWMNKKITTVKLFMSVSLLMAAVLSITMAIVNPKVIFTYALALLPLFFYLKVRKIWYLKNIPVAFVWTLMLVFLPLQEAGADILFYVLFALAFFFLFLALTIPFEIRDLRYDMGQADVKTIAIVMGVDRTKILTIICLGISFVLLWIFDREFALVLVFPYLVSLIAVASLKSPIHKDKVISDIDGSNKKREYEYSLLLDGIILLTALCALLSA
jgi:4-hydroxybenzoate polyprenyltransferase